MASTSQHSIKPKQLKRIQRYHRAIKRFLWFVMSCCVTLLVSQPWLPLWSLSIDEVQYFKSEWNAQTIAKTEPSTPEARVKVEEVIVQGVTGKLQDMVYQTIKLKPGNITTRSQIQEDINAIFATGLFQNVQAKPEDTPKGVRVTFEVKSNPIFRQINLISGKNRQAVIPPQILNDLFRSQYGSIINYNTLQKSVQDLLKWYRSKGYSLAQTTGSPNISEDGVISLKISEGVIESIKIRLKDQKNQETKEQKIPDSIILQAIETKSGMIFNKNDLLIDLQRLSGLSIFDDVKLALEPGQNPEEVIVFLDIVEQGGSREYLLGTAERVLKAERDLKLARQQKDPIAESKALRLLAKIQSNTEKYQTALKISQGTNDRLGEAEIYQGLAYLYNENISSEDKDEVKKQKKNQAINSYKTALKIYQELKQETQAAIVLRNIGFLYQELKEYPAAIEAYQQAILLLEKLNQPFWLALTLNSLATNYREIEDFDQAFLNQQKAVLTLKNININSNQFENHSLIIQAKKAPRSERGTLSASFGYSSKSGTQSDINFYDGMHQFRKVSPFDVKMLEGMILINLGGLYQGVGDYQQAIYAFKESFSVLKFQLNLKSMLLNAGIFEKEKYIDLAINFIDLYENFVFGKMNADIGELDISKKKLDQVFVKGSLFLEDVLDVINTADVKSKEGSQLESPSDSFLSAIMPFFSGVFSKLLTSSLDQVDSQEDTNRFYYDLMKQSLPRINHFLNKKTELSTQIQPYLPLLELANSYIEGEVLFSSKSYEKALVEQQKVLSKWSTITSINLTTNQSNLLIKEAIEQLQDIYHAKAYTALGKTLLALRKPQEAIEHQKQALGILQTYNAKQKTDRPIVSSTIAALKQNMPENSMAEALHELGKAYTANQQYNLALQTYAQALPFWEKTKSFQKAANTEWEMAIAQKKQGNLTQAKIQIEQAIDRIESENAQLEEQKKQEDRDKKYKKSTPYKSYLNLADYLASKHNYYAFYIDLLMQLHQQSPNSGYAELAFQASERSHGKSLRAMLNRANQKMGQPSSTSSQSQSNGLQIAQPLSLKEIQQQLLDDQTILLEYFLGQDHSYLWTVNNTELKSYLLPKQAEIESNARQLISLFRSQGYQLGDREISTAQSSSSNSQNNSQNNAQNAPENTTEIDIALQLSQILLGNIAEQLKNQKLLIVADGILHYLPFSALPKLSKENTPLIVDHEIIGLPSASLGLSLKKNKRPQLPTKTLAILADPIFSRNDDRLKRRSNSSSNTADQSRSIANEDNSKELYQRLLGTRKEAQQISALIPAETTVSKFDAEASRQFALNADLNQYRILHIASHGIFNSQNPARSGMILSALDQQGELQRSLLSTADVFNLNLAADLVVLSGCTTALGKEIQGEGLIGMTGGLMYAGTRQVTAGLWDVDDDGTALLMTQFYQGLLKQGLSPAAALRSAQLHLLNSPNWKSPYYWAAFTIQGSGV